MNRTLLTLSLLLCGAVRAAAQDVSLLRPGGGGTFDLVACDLVDGRPIAGNPIEVGLVPVACHLNGLSALEELDPRAGATEALPTGGSILRLPNDAGSLLLMRRDAASTRYGWWHVTPDGVAHRLLERPGVGPNGADNPFLARAAASPDGARAMFGTVPDAGGDLIVAALDGSGVLEPRTVAQGALDLRAESLLLGREFGVATHAGGALVIPGAAFSPAIDVAFPGGTPAHFGGATVFSPRGMRAALVAGADPTSTHAWVVDELGAATCANDGAMQLDGAGHFPEAINGPWLAVSDDGQRCAWRATIAGKSECHAARLDTPSPVVDHLTRDANYLDTLDQVGQLGFMSTVSMVMGVGETLPGGGFDRVDLFEVRFETDGTITQRNLTASSGQSLPPFTLPPTIESMQIMRSGVPDKVIIYDDHGSNGKLLYVQSGISGSSILLDDVRELDWARSVGDEIWFSAERDFGSARPRHVFRVAGDLSNAPTILVSGGEDLLFEGPLVGDDWLAYRRELENGPVTLERVFASGTLEVLVPASAPVVQGPVRLPNDHLGAIVSTANGPRGIVLRPDALRGYLLRTPVPTGTALLGR